MELENLLQVSRSTSLPQVNSYKAQEEQQHFPASWGADSVSISQEARTALSASAQNDTPGQKDDDTVEIFAEYMDKAKGNSSSSGSAEEQLENLRKKPQSLQSKLAQVASSGSMPEETKSSMMENLNAQIQQVTTQIAELLKGQSASSA